MRLDEETQSAFPIYGRRADLMGWMYTVLVGKGTRVTRPLKRLGAITGHPLQWLTRMWPFGWSRRMVTLLVMQTLDNAIALRPKKGWLAQHTKGIAQSTIVEALANIPTTAHVL